MADQRRSRVEMQNDAREVLSKAFTAEQQRALQTIWGINADSLEDSKQFTRRAFTWLAVGLAIIGVFVGGLGVLGIVIVNQHHSETVRIAKSATQATVTSRYDAAYLSCLATNNGNRLAKQRTQAVFIEPTQANVDALVDVLRPLRSSTAAPPPPLPKKLPAGWVTGCDQYARKQVSIQLPVVASSTTVPTPPPVTSTQAP